MTPIPGAGSQAPERVDPASRLRVAPARPPYRSDHLTTRLRATKIRPSPMPTASASRLPVTRFWEFLSTRDLPDLGPGPRPGTLPERTVELRVVEATRDLGLSGPDTGLLEAIALLYHDHHDAAHNRVQDRTDAEGCLVHAILHRREPDHWNAAYWFRRVSGHPIYRALTPGAIKAAQHPEARTVLANLTLSGDLDPLALVQECRRVAERPCAGSEAYLRTIQHLEFVTLVEHLLT